MACVRVFALGTSNILLEDDIRSGNVCVYIYIYVHMIFEFSESRLSSRLVGRLQHHRRKLSSYHICDRTGLQSKEAISEDS